MTTKTIMMGALCLALGAQADETLVARKTMDPLDFFHATELLMGRNYWTIMTAEYYSVPGGKPSQKYHNPELKEKLMFKDCGIYSYGSRYPRKDTEPATYRTVRENYCTAEPRGDAEWASWDPTPEKKPGHPILAVCSSKRNVKMMSGKIDLDMADYAAFTNSHPNVFAWSMFAEFDNDSRSIYGAIANLKKKEPDNPRVKELERDWGTRLATNRYERLKQLRQYFDRKAAMYWGDVGLGQSECCGYMTTHITAAWGVKVIALETSGTTEVSDYRWDVQGMFARGASRQFSKLWNWYPALHSCGYTKDLKTWTYCGANWSHEQPSYHSPAGGLSRSLMNRLYYYAYVNGANFIQPEGRTSFTTYDKGPEKEILTDRGEDFDRFNHFAKDHPDRGSTFAHCAILTPFAQMYPGCGGAPCNCLPYERGDQMVDGVFFTVVPAPAMNHKALARIGVESNNLHNTSFAMSYDVLVPDSPQKPADFQKILDKYPVAYLAGTYRAEDDITTPLVKYVSEGGTLVLNAIYLDRFPKDFAGVAWDGKTTFAERGWAMDDRGEMFAANGEYEVADLKLTGARAFLRTAPEHSKTLMTTFAYGKGRVLVTAPLYMAPVWGKRKYWTVQSNVEFGWETHAYTRYLLARLQDEVYPVKVTGDCQYGINRTKTGWWLWMLNNRGVKKWIDVAETVDETCASKVEVDFRDLKVSEVTELTGGTRPPLGANGFTSVIPAGGVKIYELKEGAR